MKLFPFWYPGVTVREVLFLDSLFGSRVDLTAALAERRSPSNSLPGDIKIY